MVKNAQSRLEIIPGFDGSAMVRNAPALSPNLPHFGVSVLNPQTKQYENTLSTYRGDLGDLAQNFPGVVPNTNRISIATQAINWPGTGRGVYQVQRDGVPITFVPGQDLAWAHTIERPGMDVVDPSIPALPVSPIAEKLTLPKDFKAAGEQLQKTLPSFASGGWVLVPNDPVTPSGYMLGYRPRLTGEAPPMKSLDQKAGEYQGSPGQQQRNTLHDLRSNPDFTGMENNSP
jgi:hypothetical protein